MIDIPPKSREKSFGQTGKLGPFRPEGWGNLSVWGPERIFSAVTHYRLCCYECCTSDSISGFITVQIIYLKSDCLCYIKNVFAIRTNNDSNRSRVLFPIRPEGPKDRIAGGVSPRKSCDNNYLSPEGAKESNF